LRRTAARGAYAGTDFWGCSTFPLAARGNRAGAYIVPVFLVRIPAWIFLGAWFLYQLVEADFGLFSASANGGGVAFFAHVGGFIFGVLAARILTRARRITPRAR
jgi:membrane associated rhomboid family serine protease